MVGVTGSGSGRDRFSAASLWSTTPHGSSSAPEKRKFRIMERLDVGILGRGVKLYANYFPVKSEATIYRYALDIKSVASDEQSSEKSLSREICVAIRNKFFLDKSSSDELFSSVLYDGEKRIFSAKKLPIEEFKVDLDGGHYSVTLKRINLQLSRFKLSDSTSNVPDDILRCFSLVTKENPCTQMFSVGEGIYRETLVKDFQNGVAAYEGLIRKMKRTSKGLALCADYSCQALPPVLDSVTGQRRFTFTSDQLEEFRKFAKVSAQERKDKILEILKSTYETCGNLAENYQTKVDKKMIEVHGRVLDPPQLRLREKHSTCQTESTCKEENTCKVNVKANSARDWDLRDRSLMSCVPIDRWALIYCRKKDEETDEETTKKATKRANKKGKKKAKEFIGHLKKYSTELGIHMKNPLVTKLRSMKELNSVKSVSNLLRNVNFHAKAKAKEKGEGEGALQLIICVMEKKDDGYRTLKWVSEVEVGVVTQCCVPSHGKNHPPQYFRNLCLGINAKVGGSNVGFGEKLPHFDEEEDKVMFIGADVNHPGATDPPASCSIAAVVGSINWPASNRYVARVKPQKHGQENIEEFGSLCADLVRTFARHDKDKKNPNKIVIFRDGVGDSQLNMVLNKELADFVQVICKDGYEPKITVVVAQKRNGTRLFNETEWGCQNVSPGTVVDTGVVHPFLFDFYMCSHYVSEGTCSKPIHYYVLWDGNGFTSDEMQKLIYFLCFTHAPSTKPLALVPPVYYADKVAYRGRIFLQQAKKERDESDSGPSIREEDYKLHERVEDVMYFV